SMTASPASITADGTETSALTLTLNDAQGNPVAGESVSLVSSLSNVTFSSITDNGNGTYTGTLTGTKAGTAHITVTVGGSAFAVNATSVTLNPGVPVVANSALTAAPAGITADGTDASTLTLTLKDANNNPVPGQTVAFLSSLSNSAAGTVTDNHDGTYTASLTGTTSGTTTVTVTVGGSAFSVTAAGVTLTPGAPVAANSTLTASPLSIVADNTATSTLTLTLKDANNNLVPGQTVVFASDLANSTAGTATDNGDGTYTTTLKGTKAGTANITVTVGGTAFGVTPASVMLTNGAPVAANSVLTATPASITADGTSAATLKLALYDAYMNPVANQSVSFASSLANSTAGTATNNGDGTYTATLTGTTTGTSTVTVTLGGSAFAVTGVTVTLTAGMPVAANSSMTVSPSTIPADGDSAATITLTLKDANNNLAPGKAVALVSSLSDVSFSAVTDKGDGTYTATMSGTTAGTSTLSITVGGTAVAVTATVTLTVPDMPSTTTFSVSGATFAFSTGFPTTGFVDATYQVLYAGSASNNSNYTWSVDQSWLTVDSSGNVKFNAKPTSATKTATVIATPKSGVSGVARKYTFTLSRWYTGTALQRTFTPAFNYCGSGVILEYQYLISTGSGVRSGSSNALWNQWGNLSTYVVGQSPASGAVVVWSSSVSLSSAESVNYYKVELLAGSVYSASGMKSSASNGIYDTDISTSVAGSICRSNI
ncbi:invasin domain 3-containing protein, partial [Enterobacter cloacae]